MAMEPEHVAVLLAMIARFDRTSFDKQDAKSWHAILKDLDFEDCQEAIVEYYGDNEFMKPKDVKRGALAIREQRARHNGAPVGAGGTVEIPDADPDDWQAYMAALREGRMRCGDRLEHRPIGALVAGRPFQSVAPVTQIEMARERRALPGGDR